MPCLWLSLQKNYPSAQNVNKVEYTRVLPAETDTFDYNLSVDEIISDYRLACESRSASLMGRKEVFMGKAKFGVFGDGKEVAQIAMAKAFQNGDFHSGYYRDQTFMLAIGEVTLQQFFAQLYANANTTAEPHSSGRQMNAHFATQLVDEVHGGLLPQTNSKHSISDISPTAGQIPRLVGLGYASKLYRKNPLLKDMTDFSVNGNEVAWGTIGDASTSEGMFLEAINAIGVLQIPVVMAVWDDDYGISVPKPFHTTKESISEALEGFRRTEHKAGIEIIRIKGWDYEKLCDTFRKAGHLAREQHVPVLIHVEELTQPQGHSTSGSHERYKSKDRLAWERAHDCNRKMREWILRNGMASEEQLKRIEAEAEEAAKKAKNDAWKALRDEMDGEFKNLKMLIRTAAEQSKNKDKVLEVLSSLGRERYPIRMDGIRVAKKAIRYLRNDTTEARNKLNEWLHVNLALNEERYSSHLYSETPLSALQVEEIVPTFDENSPLVDGREVLQACFDKALERDPRVFAFGEDVGKIGDVNQGLAGLQDKHGQLRVTDTGIRESTIIGQGIGAAIRGLRPIAEIQYLDYIFYPLATLTDDLACLRYRTKGKQAAPLIIRTRGHRLEGIWHSGSPIGAIMHSLRGIYLLTPRNMVQAAGLYNTMLQSDDTAIIIESLNGYRLKERIPKNIGEFTVPLGKPDILREGKDITIVTYGSMCRIVLEAAEQLAEFDISCEVIDVQTLLPFDIEHGILASVKKTNRVIFADEDVPGGASAYMMHKVLEEQGGYRYLDAQPVTVTSKDHRPAYASDGDYFSKPNVEEIFDRVYEVLREANPEKYPSLYS